VDRPETILEVADLHTYYGNIHALQGVSMRISRGEILTLIGSNGAGKTTLLHTLTGILRAKEGIVLFEGSRIDHLPPHKILTAGIAQVPEGRKIFRRLTVAENLELGAFTRRDAHSISKDMDAAFRLFPVLRERRRQIAGTLSGGEQQMLAISRALMSRPRLLLLDEPSMGLAPILQEAIFLTIRQINREGTTILLVEQNAMMAFQIASRGYVIQTGRIVLEDRAERLQANEMVRELYLGGEAG
jgi:branched-chain amino acid transport system ATP-binding protein